MKITGILSENKPRLEYTLNYLGYAMSSVYGIAIFQLPSILRRSLGPWEVGKSSIRNRTGKDKKPKNLLALIKI